MPKHGDDLGQHDCPMIGCATGTPAKFQFSQPSRVLWSHPQGEGGCGASGRMTVVMFNLNYRRGAAPAGKEGPAVEAPPAPPPEPVAPPPAPPPPPTKGPGYEIIPEETATDEPADTTTDPEPGPDPEGADFNASKWWEQ